MIGIGTVGPSIAARPIGSKRVTLAPRHTWHPKMRDHVTRAGIGSPRARRLLNDLCWTLERGGVLPRLTRFWPFLGPGSVAMSRDLVAGAAATFSGAVGLIRGSVAGDGVSAWVNFNLNPQSFSKSDFCTGVYIHNVNGGNIPHFGSSGGAWFNEHGFINSDGGNFVGLMWNQNGVNGNRVFTLAQSQAPGAWGMSTDGASVWAHRSGRPYSELPVTWTQSNTAALTHAFRRSDGGSFSTSRLGAAWCGRMLTRAQNALVTAAVAHFCAEKERNL